MTDRVLVEILVAAPIETVWKALREPAEIARWFGWDYPTQMEDIEMMFGHWKADEANHVLISEGMPDRFALEAQGSSTIVRVIRSAPVTDGSWQGIYDDVNEGWITFLHEMKFVLERHPGAARRTLFLNGRARSAATGQPAAALGLSSVSIVPIGQRYSVETAHGDTLEGTVWYRSAYQLGLTVDGYGDGLLVVNARPRTAKSHHGGGTVMILTYGLDDAAYNRLRERWSAWWAGAYEVIETQP